MLLNLRIVLAASFAAVLLLIGGFGLIATLRTPGKPSMTISGPAEITGSIAVRGEKSQSLTDTDKTARPGQPAAEAAQPAPQPVRAANVDNTEKAQAPEAADEDKPAKSKRAAKPRPQARSARQEVGANFRANNPLSFPFFGAGAIGQ
jgi:hypothetical protein